MKIKILAISGFLFFLAIYFLLRESRPIPLPRSAAEVNEFRSGPYGFTGDCIYALKAKITRQVFHELVLDQRLVVRGPEFEPILFGLVDKRWWSPDWEHDEFYVNRKFDISSRRILTCYQNGFVFFVETTGY